MCIWQNKVAIRSDFIALYFFLAQGVAPMQVQVLGFVQVAGGVAAGYRGAQELEVDIPGTRPTVETHWLMMTTIFRHICLS